MSRGATRVAAAKGRVAAMVLILVAALVPGLGQTTASAAPGAPSGLAPASGAATTASPLLSWSRLAGATEYDVQASLTADFSTTLFSQSTTNRQMVPTSLLPDGTVYWRVRAKDSSGAGGWASTSMTVKPPAAPTPTGPANGGPALKQPSSPPVLSWQAVQGAAMYQVEVDPDGDFIGAAVYSTQTTSLVLPDPVSNGTYTWHVRAQLTNGLYTAFGPAWKFTIGALDQVTATSPAEASAVEDVYLEWQPVKGAKTYELQVSTDQDFNTIIDSKTNIKSTRYSPAQTYLNDQYYWRVRARNNQDETIDWVAVTPLKSFQRNWLEKPTPVYPPSSAASVVGDDLYFQWTPVVHATRYQLDIGTDPNFSPNTYQTCITASTTFTVGYLDGRDTACTPSQGVVMYWRVRALDAPANVQGIYSSISTVLYASSAVQRVSPTNGATVAVPTMTWQAAQDAERYRLIVVDRQGNSVTQVDTYALSWTPSGNSGWDPARGPFGWTVQAIDADGKTSPKYGNWTFNLSPTTGSASSPEPTYSAGPTSRFPTLTWTPVTGAAYYRVDVGVHSSGFWFTSSAAPLTSSNWPYAAASDTGKTLITPGQYDWQVEAFASNGVSLGRGSVGMFTISELAPVAGRQIALTGQRLDTLTACSFYLDAPTGSRMCENVPATPVLDWQPVTGAAYYMLYIARDRELTNLVQTATTVGTRWTPTSSFDIEALADSQAGQAYYWYVRPCKAMNVCAPDPVSTVNAATNAFSKLSPRVVQQSPPNASTVSNAVTFTWADYLATNLATTYGETGEKSNQAAMQYRIQVATTSSFANLLDNQVVDQATYTAWDRTYPEGTSYWRVQALDARGNGLQWSQTWSFTKSSPAPALTSPQGAVGPRTTACPSATVTASCTSGTSPFVWAPTDFAGGYQLEVYKNDDANWSPSNRVISVVTKQAAFANATPLPASSSAYVWRVARLDADGRPGQWSAPGRFYSIGASPTLTAPTTGSMVNGFAPYFAWSPTTGAVSYRFERRAAGTTSLTEQVTTNAQAYAPTRIIDSGSWQWRVVAIDVQGVEIGSSEWRPFVVDNARGTFTGITPRRILDTRTGLGAAKAKVNAGGIVNVSVPGLPVGTTSIILNVTAIAPTTSGYVTVYPAGAARPSTYNVVYATGRSVPNMVATRVGPGGQVSLYNSSGSVDLVADLAGYFAPDLGAGFTSVTPVRVMDTRSGVGGRLGALGAGTVATLKVPNLPAGTKAITANVTVTAPTANGSLSLYPYGVTRPNVSSLNFVKAQTVSNLVTVAVDASGRVNVYNASGSTQVIVDLVGYYSVGRGSKYLTVGPSKFIDTRSGIGLPKAKVTGGTTKSVVIPGLAAGTTAVALNVTVSAPTKAGFVTVFPSDASRPSPSTITFAAAQTISNMVVVRPGTGNKVSFYVSSGAADLVVHVVGRYTP